LTGALQRIRLPKPRKGKKRDMVVGALCTELQVVQRELLGVVVMSLVEEAVVDPSQITDEVVLS
jgi:hypothetical protein